VLTVLFGLASSCSYAVSDMMAQRVVRASSALRMVAWVLSIGVLVSLPLMLLVDGLPHGGAEWRAAGWAALAGIIYVGAYFSLLSGFAKGDLSLVAALSSLQGGFTAVAAIVLGEQVTPLLAAGLALTVAGAVLAAVQDRARTTAGAGWALLSAVLFAGVVTIYGQAGDLPWLSVAAVSRLASFSVAVPLALVLGGLAIPRRLRSVAVGSGLLELLGVVALTVSVGIGPLAVAGVTASQFATFALLLGVVVLGERPRPHQLAGVGATIVGVTILGAFVPAG